MHRWCLMLGLLSGCALSRGVAPLEDGQGAVTGSFGGPIFSNIGAPIPMPLSAFGYARGVGGKANVYGAFYPSGLLMFGVPGLDLGAAYEVLPTDGAVPRVMVSGTGYFFVGGRKGAQGPPGGARFWPGSAVVFSWDLGDQDRPHRPYIGWDSFFATWQGSVRYFGSPMLGAELRVSKRVGLQLETKWISPYEDVKPNFIDWASPGQHGAISVQLGGTVRLGGK